MLWQRKTGESPTLCCSAFRSCVRSTFSSSSSSALCRTLPMALWYSRSWLWNKKRQNQTNGLGNRGRKRCYTFTYRNRRHGAVESVEASPGDGAGAEVDQLAADGGEGHLDALQILQQKQDAAVTHCQDKGALSTGPFPRLPSPRSPGPRDTDLHTSRCPGRWPRGSRARACRRRTASRSARWSRCTPPCAGRRSPLGTRTLSRGVTGIPVASLRAGTTSARGEGAILFPLGDRTSAY